MLEFSCKDGLLPSDVIVAACSPDGMWIPDPNMHTCKSITSGIVLVSVYCKAGNGSGDEANNIIILMHNESRVR